MEAWSSFAAESDLDVVEAAFALGGPQYRQFEAEAASEFRQAIRLEALELAPRQLGEESATVWARVRASDVGSESEIFQWDFDLVLESGLWKIWTVVAAPRPEPTINVAPTDSELTTSTTSTNSASSPPNTYAVAASPSTDRGIRLPLLSAWIIVITVVGVALAGYLAPRLDRRTEK